jgi:pimeloyl-ACP methyl ester carboxylesterase
MVLVDLRNHGRSAEIEGLEPPHDMVNAANDLAHLVKAQGWAWPDVVIGHSMGRAVLVATMVNLFHCPNRFFFAKVS